MKNFTHRWTRSGHFFSKLGHFFFNFRKRTGETSSPSPPLVTRLWIDLVNKVSNARQRPPSRQKFLLAFATFRGITFQHVYSSGSTNILVTLLKFCDSSSSYYNETKYSKNIFRNSCFCIVRKCMKSYVWTSCYCTKMKFYFKDFFSKCDQIRRNPRIWSHLLKKPFNGKLHILWSASHLLLQNSLPKGSWKASLGHDTPLRYTSRFLIIRIEV